MKFNKIIIVYLMVLMSSTINLKAQYFTHNWSHELGNNGPGYLTINGSCVTNQGHYITVGKVSGTVDADLTSNVYFVDGNHPSSSSYSAFFAEYDSSAALIRAFALSPLTNKTSFEAVAVDDNGNIFVTGGMQDSAYLDPYNPYSITAVNGPNGMDAFIAKYDASMHLIWVKSFPTAYSISPKKILIDHQNNIILAGDFNNTVDIDPSNAIHNLASYSAGSAASDAFLAKFDQNGLLQWAKNLGTTVNDFIGAIAIDNSNNIYIGVNYEGDVAFIDSLVMVSSPSVNFICITKFNAYGQFVWNKPISGTSGTNNDLLDLKVNHIGEVFFTGKLRGNAYFQNPAIYLNSGTSTGCDFIAKLAVNGDCIWAYAAYTDVSVGYSIALDTQSNIYLAGTFIDVKDFDYKTGVVNISSNPSTLNNYYLASYDSTGSYRWAFRLATTGIPEVNISNNGKVWINGDFNSNFDVDPGTTTNNLNTTNSTEFVSSYTSNGTYQAGFAFKGSGSIKEKVTALNVSDSGNVIVGGMFSGAIDLDPFSTNLVFTSSLDSNAYIASYNASGTLNWANQIKGRVYIKGLKSDNAGNIYITGYFASTTYFDVNNSPNTYYTLPGGTLDIFLIKYNSNGVLQWIHTFGSSVTDKGLDIVIDHNENVIISGIFVTDIDFDPSAGQFHLTTPQGTTNGFIAKYDSDGNFIHAIKIVAQNANHLCVDQNNNIIVNGSMDGFGNFDVAGTGNVIYAVGGPNNTDYYIAKYDSALNYLWAFGLGNTGNNSQSSNINVDQAGNIFFTGYFGTVNDSIDVSPGTSVFKVVGNLGVLCKYTSSGNLLWGINTGIKNSNYVAADLNGNPTIVAQYFPNVDLDPSPGTSILPATLPSTILVRYSSVGQYLGATTYSAADNNYTVLPSCIDITDSNKVIIGGYFTGNINFDLASGVQNLFINDGLITNTNGFVVSFNQTDYLAQVPPSAAFNSNSNNFCEGICINFQDNSLYSPNNWNWSFPGANPSTSTSQHPQNICYPAAGTYNVQLIVSNPLGADTLNMINYIQVDAVPQTNAGNDISVCEGSSLQLYGSGANTYSWSPSATLINPNDANPIASPINTTTYTLTGTNGSCSTTDDVTINVNPNPSTPTITPVSGELQSSPAFAYQWYFNGSAINGATLQNIFPSQIGNYTVTVFDANGCFASSSPYLVTVVGVEQLTDEFIIKLQPNPVDDIIQFYASQTKNDIVFNLYDIVGNIIHSQNMNLKEGVNTIGFDVALLPAGVYIIDINDGKALKTIKMLKY